MGRKFLCFMGLTALLVSPGAGNAEPSGTIEAPYEVGERCVTADGSPFGTQCSDDPPARRGILAASVTGWAGVCVPSSVCAQSTFVRSRAKLGATHVASTAGVVTFSVDPDEELIEGPTHFLLSLYNERTDDGITTTVGVARGGSLPGLEAGISVEPGDAVRVWLLMFTDQFTSLLPLSSSSAVRISKIEFHYQ